jgi:hypothetical protein
MIDKLHTLPDRALDLVSQVGDGMRHLVPDHAGKWLEAGAKLGALKSGTRIAGTFVRRHPAALAATVAGAGLLWYLARRRARQAETGAIEGSATRIEARRRNDGDGAKRRTRATGTATRGRARRGGSQDATT